MEYSLYEAKESVKNHSVRMDQTAVFMGSNMIVYEGAHASRYGIFNRESKEIIWSSELVDIDDNPLWIRELAYAKNKLYILDQFYTLHILEGIDSIA